MKWFIWAACGVLAALWTASMAALAGLVGWAGQSLGGAGPGAASLPALPGADAVPAWLAPWLDVADLQAWHAAAQQVITAAQGALPLLGTATGWLEPLVWVVWGIGLLSLLALAGGLHGLLVFMRRQQAGAVPRSVSA